MNTSGGMKAAWWIGLGVLAALVCTISAVSLGERFGTRWDVTATREHALSARTVKLLSGLQQPHQVAIWGDFATLEAQAKRSVLETVELFERSGAKVTFSVLDTGGGGREQFVSLVQSLANAETSGVKGYASSAKALIDATGAFGKDLSEVVGPGMDELAKTFSPANREAATRRASAVRAAGRNLMDLAAKATADLGADPIGAGMPELNAQAVARPVRDALGLATEQFGKFASELASVGEAPGASDELILATRSVVRSITEANTRAQGAISAFNAAKAPAVVRIVDALKSPRGVLLMGPEEPGLLALDFDELFAPGSRADARRRAEELLATGLASMSSAVRPIAVFMHAEAQSVLERGRLFETLLARLTLRNFEVVEWPVLTMDVPPGFADLRGTAARPVVYIALSPDSSASGGTGGLPGAQRAQKLGAALSRVIADGGSVLVNLNPSVLPSAGQPDPIAAAIEAVGLKADSARPIFTRVTGSGGSTTISPDALALAPEATGSELGSTIAAGMRNLRTFAGFPLTISAETGVKSAALVQIPVSENVWCESQWLGVWQTPAAQRALIQPIPTYDASKDARPDPMVIARSVEREHSGQVQRVVAVGSNNWMADFVLNQRTTIDGREVAEFPGNAELLDSAMLWLSRQDGLLSGGTVGAIALIDPLTFGQLRMLRILALVGIPIGVLGCGVLYRWLRG
ncbi:MAG: hypothetical protein KGS45_04980 [Planctomycetes bacterium]|nr:hypothetical protein [Planctomycetota bacterium]